MAQRRMFSKTITSSSNFLMMPNTSQNLYFHFGMNADDDGFCEYFGVMRMTESKPDDLRILASKGFIKIFDDKVLVILDWKENNYLRNDRYKASKYLGIYKEELALISKESAQMELGIPTGSQMETQDRLGKDRLGNTSEPEARIVDKNVDKGDKGTFPKEWYNQVEKSYCEIKKVHPQGKEWLPIQREEKMMFESKRAPEQIIKTMAVVNDNYSDWTMNTVRMKIADVVDGKLTFKTIQANANYKTPDETNYQSQKEAAIKACGKCDKGFIKVAETNSMRVCDCVRALAVKQ